MKNLKLIVLTLTVVFATACKDAKKDNGTVLETNVEKSNNNLSMNKALSITLSPKSGSDIEGTINFSQENDLVTMVGTVSGLKKGDHAIHIHEKADCSSNDGKSAGGHNQPPSNFYTASKLAEFKFRYTKQHGKQYRQNIN